MTEEKIQKIVKDIISLDTNFQGREKEIKNIVLKLLESQPEVRIDDNFIYNLRLKLLEKAEKMETANLGFAGLWLYLKNLKRVVLAGSALTLLAVFGISVYLAGNLGKVTLETSGDQAISRVRENAFGSLATILESSSDTESRQSSLSLSQPSPLALSGGGGAETATDVAEGKGIAIMPEFVNYKYVYRGGEFQAPDSKMSVYKRTAGDAAQTIFSDILSKFNFDSLDLVKFGQAKVDNISLSEDRDFGYAINIDLKNGSLSIYKNWEKWPNQGWSDCEGKGEVCTMAVRTSIISITDAFLKNYGIDASSFGKGKVQDYGRRLYSAVAEKPSSSDTAVEIMPYFSEEIQVVYPLLIEGKPVHDQSGNEQGLTLSVDIRHKKVASLYNLTSRNFDSSLYEAETDVSKIISIAEKGGWYGGYYYGYPEAEKTVEISLGKPFLGLVSTWKYDEGSGYEIFIPAFFFPVSQPKDVSYFYQKNIVVPLVKEAFDSINNPKPLPLPGTLPTSELPPLQKPSETKR